MLEPPACLLIDTIDYPHPWLWDDRDLPESERRRTQYVNTVKPDEFRRLAESSGLRVLEQEDVGNFKTLFLLQAPLL